VIRVLIVDDDPLVRSGLGLLLAGAPNLEVVGEAADGAHVVDAVSALRPHVVLMDVRMPKIDGIAATRALTRRADGPAVIVLTTFDGDETVLGALRAGAAGFLLKHTPPAEIVGAIRRAAAGDPVLSPDVIRRLIALAAGPARDASRFGQLTERERRVALAVADGLGNAEIGERLHLSTSTVKAAISGALATLDLDNRVQLAIIAHEHRRESG
jgi:DNA-binding NarL/FixJ family response regulator